MDSFSFYYTRAYIRELMSFIGAFVREAKLLTGLMGLILPEGLNNDFCLSSSKCSVSGVMRFLLGDLDSVECSLTASKLIMCES